MNRYWFAMLVLPFLQSWVLPARAADDPNPADCPGILAKATGRAGVGKRCGQVFAGPIRFTFNAQFGKASFPEYHVVRSAKELLDAYLIYDARSHDDVDVQRAAQARAAEYLKVKAIDWDKQMLIAILAPYQAADKDFAVEFTTLRPEGRALQIGWRQVEVKAAREEGERAPALQLVYAVALVDRFNGLVGFAAERQVIAKVTTVGENKANIGPIYFDGKDKQSTIRSAEELAARGQDPGQAKDAAVQKQAQADLAQLLKVKDIDWNKHMVIAIDGGTNRVEHEVEFVSLQVEDKTLTVTWKLNNRGRFILTRSKAVALLERWDGPVKFKTAEPK